MPVKSKSLPSVSKVSIKQNKYGYKKCAACDSIILHKIKRDIERKKFCSKSCFNKSKNTLKYKSLNCKNCNKTFSVPINLKRYCCNLKCRREYSKNVEKLRHSVTGMTYLLAKEGKTTKEISKILNKPQGTISSYLNKIKFRKFPNGGTSYRSIVKKLKQREDYKKCCICKFDRIVEIAHIIPASKGGELTYKNTLPLCANHHYLFDHNKLYDHELEIIEFEKELRNGTK